MSIHRVDISNVIIREALATLIRDVFTDETTYWAGRTRFENGYWWIAFDKKHAVGFGGMVPSYQQPKAGYLCASGVLPSHRGKGIQKLLIRKRIAFAKELGWTEVRSDTINGNAASANALIACGFRMFEPAKPWGTSQAIYWRRCL